MLNDLLTPTQIDEWEAYDKLDPIGEWRADFRMAKMASVITNLFYWAYGKPEAEPTSANDFMPKWDEAFSEQADDPNIFWSLSKHGWVKRKRQSTEEIKQMALAVANSQNKNLRTPRTTPPRKKK